MNCTPRLHQSTIRAGGVARARLASWFGIVALCVALIAPAAFAAATAPGSFAARFTETRTLPGFATPLVSHGVMRFSAGGSFRWQVDSPYTYVFEMSGDAAHEVLPDGTRRTLDPGTTPWLDAVRRIFVSALRGDPQQLQQYFRVEIVASAGAGRTIGLTPLPGSLAKVITHISVVETAPGKPSHLSIDEAAGGHIDIRFAPLAPAGAP